MLLLNYLIGTGPLDVCFFCVPFYCNCNVIVIRGKQLRRSPRVRESYVAFFYLLCERVFDVCFKGNDLRLFLTNPWRSLGALSRQSVRASIRRPKLPGFVHPFLVLCDWGEKISSLVQQTRAQMKNVVSPASGVSPLRVKKSSRSCH